MPEAVEALKRERKDYLEKRLRFVERWEETWREHPKAKDLIFPSETGGPMNRNNLHRRHFKPLARKAGLPEEARLYTLRHTFATLWMESNEPIKVLQEILGHSRRPDYEQLCPCIAPYSGRRFWPLLRAFFARIRYELSVFGYHR